MPFVTALQTWRCIFEFRHGHFSYSMSALSRTKSHNITFDNALLSDGFSIVCFCKIQLFFAGKCSIRMHVRYYSFRFARGCCRGLWENKNADVLPLQTVMKYFEPLFAIIQSFWPSNPNLQGSQDTRPQWWINLRTQLQKGYEKVKPRGEEEVFDAKTMTLCLINDPRLIRHNSKTIDALLQADMMFVCRNLMNNAQLCASRNCENRAQLLTSSHAVCRSDEVKWVRISAWVFDLRYNVIEIGWI